MEAQELAAEFLGRAVDASVMERLQAEGVDFRAHLPGAVSPGALVTPPAGTEKERVAVSGCHTHGLGGGRALLDLKKR